MGLIKDNYLIENKNITISPAYCMVGEINIRNNMAIAEMLIHKTREDLQNYEPLERVNISCEIDRNLPIYEQLYTRAKELKFSDWQDNIV